MSTELVNKAVGKFIPELFLKSDLADVYFTFLTNGQSVIKVPAHKNILAVASPVFKAMFYGPMKEKDEVEIVDVDDSAFKEFLQMFYLAKVVLTMKNIEAVVGLADKYDMMDCLSKCAELHENKITKENSIWGLQLAISLNDQKLKESCEHHIQYFTIDHFESEMFLQCNRETVMHILKLDALYGCSEPELFDAVIAWAKISCEANGLDGNDPKNLKNQLDEMFYLIRFGVMTGKEITAIMSNELYNGLFTKDDLTDIICVRSDRDFQSQKFRNTPRLQLEWDSNNVVTCIRGEQSVNVISYVQKRESTWFSTNAPVLLGKIRFPYFYDKSDHIAKMHFIINIIECQKNNFSSAHKALYTGTMEYPLGGKLLLAQPIIIDPRKMYEIRFEAPHANPNEFRYQPASSESKVKLNENVEIKFHQNPCDYNKQSGLVAILAFNCISK